MIAIIIPGNSNGAKYKAEATSPIRHIPHRYEVTREDTNAATTSGINKLHKVGFHDGTSLGAIRKIARAKPNKLAPDPQYITSWKL
jgi:hypothetical protein